MAITLNSKQLADMQLSANMSTTNDIATYVDEKIDEMVANMEFDDYLSKTNGGTISNDLSVDGNLSVSGSLNINGVDVLSAIDNIKINDYTAFEVFPTNEVIQAGTTSDVKFSRNIWKSGTTFVKGSAVYHEATDTVYKCLENCKDVEPMVTEGWESKWSSHNGFDGQYYKYMTEVPANNTINIRFYSYSKTREECDIIIDWGDGNISEVSNLSDTSVTSFTNYEDNNGSSYLYSNLYVKHTYSNENCGSKFIIKIYGKDYFLIRCGAHDKNPIISRIFDRDLPIANNVTNVSSLAAYSKKILQVIVPYDYNFGNIINFSVVF